MTTIERTDDGTDDLIDYWQPEELDDEVQVVCGKGEAVVFFAEGEVLAEFGPGRHAVTADEFEGLADWLDDADEDVEVAFVRTTPVEVEVAGAFTHGEDEVSFTASATVRVTEASAFIGLLERLGEDESFEQWIGDELAVQVQTFAPTLKEPIFAISAGAMNEEIVEGALGKGREVLAAYGVEVTTLDPGSFEWALSQQTLDREAAVAAKELAARAAEPPRARPPVRYCPNRHGYHTHDVCPRCKAKMVEITPFW